MRNIILYTAFVAASSVLPGCSCVARNADTGCANNAACGPGRRCRDRTCVEG